MDAESSLCPKDEARKNFKTRRVKVISFGPEESGKVRINAVTVSMTEISEFGAGEEAQAYIRIPILEYYVLNKFFTDCFNS